MEQLTQKEFMQIKNHLQTTSLAMKKSQIYQEDVQDQELKEFFEDIAKNYQGHINRLVNNLRNFNGKEH